MIASRLRLLLKRRDTDNPLSKGIDAAAETNSAEIIPSEVLLVCNSAESND